MADWRLLTGRTAKAVFNTGSLKVALEKADGLKVPLRKLGANWFYDHEAHQALIDQQGETYEQVKRRTLEKMARAEKRRAA